MSDETITVADLAAELGVTVAEISRHVTALCHELGPSRVIECTAPRIADCVLHGSAADVIRERVRRAPGEE
jgi:hypothetical protein